MSDNENGENGDELVTKPFKFVTGELFRDSAYKELIADLLPHSWYATPKFRDQLSPHAKRIYGAFGMRYGVLISFARIGFDARFPNQNQTKHCWQNYVDYHKCIIAKGEDFAPCRQVRHDTRA
jgi:hypothetical protein